MKHFVLLGVLTLSLLSVLSPVVADVIYYTEEATQSIMCCNMDGSDPHLVLAPGQVPCGLRVDAATEQMYWTEPYVGQIWAANLNGTGAHMVLSNVNSIADLTLDVATGQIYTAQWSTGLILQGPMAGGTAATVLSTGGSPYGIEYDSGTNKVYWADWYYLHNWVRSANTDGSGATTVATGITAAQTLTVSGGWVYIGDVNANVIYRCHPDGTDFTTFVSAVNPWGMVVADGNLYWASQNEPLNTENGGSIQCVSLNGGPVQTLLTNSVRPWGIAVVDIPEPTTMLLLLAGAGLVVRRRACRKTLIH